MSFTTQGPSSSQAAYLVPNQPNVRFASIITTTDTVPGGAASGFVGVPDGIGAYDNGDGTATVLVNHEIRENVGVTRAHGFIGSFVTKLIVNTTSLAVTSMTDQAQQVFVWNGATSTYTLTTPGGAGLAGTGAISRLCSADLADVSAYFNAATGLGTTDRIYLTGEEAGPEGRGFAFVATGGDAGRTYELARHGNFSWENMVARPAASNKTVVISMDDATPGQVYVYVGDKQATGSAIDRAGLTNGSLFGIKAEFAFETNGGPTSGTFSLAAMGNVQAMSGAQLEIASAAAGVTQFLRPEDGAWDTVNSNRFYFQTTNSFNNPSRLWALDFIDATNPTLGGNLTAVLNGTEGQQMLDNLGVTKPGSYLPFGTVISGEDVGNNVRSSRLYSYDAPSDTLTTIARHNPALFGNDDAVVTAPFTIDEEPSGMVDVSAIFGNANTTAYLVATQAHYPVATPGIVEGGQLQIMYVDRPTNGGAGNDNVRGGWFNDTLGAGAGNDTMQGGDGRDTLFGESGNDSILGGAGNDTIYGGAGNDTALGGAGDDTYLVEDATDVVTELAAEGNDTVFVTASGWTAGAEIETIYLYAAAVAVTGGATADTIVANNTGLGSSMNGANGNDTIWGGAGADTLIGGAGVDVLRGGAGNDVLIGGLGNDQLVGNAGADIYTFDAPDYGYDQVFGFNRVEGDRLDMRGSGATSFGQLTLLIDSVNSNTAVVFGTNTVDVYGVANLTANDFIFV